MTKMEQSGKIISGIVLISLTIIFGIITMSPRYNVSIDRVDVAAEAGLPSNITKFMDGATKCYVYKEYNMLLEYSVGGISCVDR